MHFKLSIFILVICIISFKGYNQEIEVKNDLLNGRLYHSNVKSSITGHSFLKDEEFHLCNLIYKGIEYKDILVKYDLYNQQILYFQQIDSKLPRFIILNTDYIEKFELYYNSETYIFSNKYSKLQGLDPSIRFYQILYEGDYKYLKGSSKFIEKFEVNQESDKYVEKELYYLIINNEPKLIKRKRDFILLFNDKKKEIRKFINKNHLKIKPSYQSDIIKLIIYCESLS